MQERKLYRFTSRFSGEATLDFANYPHPSVCKTNVSFLEHYLLSHTRLQGSSSERLTAHRVLIAAAPEFVFRHCGNGLPLLQKKPLRPQTPTIRVLNRMREFVIFCDLDRNFKKVMELFLWKIGT